MASLFIVTCLFALQGAYDGSSALALLVCLPVVILGAAVGIAIFKRLSTNAFRMSLIYLSLVSGILLFVQVLYTL